MDRSNPSKETNSSPGSDGDASRVLSPVERSSEGRNLYDCLLEKLYENQSKMWNFDFLNEKPLDEDGDWIWIDGPEGEGQVVPNRNYASQNEENNLDR